MWTSAAAKAAPEMDEAGVVIGDFRLASLVHEPADESERFQEEIRTLMMASDNTGPLELSGGTTCCYFTALLGLVSKSNEGTTTTGGEGVPVPTTPACVLPQLLSSSPTTEIFPPDTAPYSMFLAAPETGEKHLGVGGSPCATDSPEKVNTTGSDCGPEPPLELEAATGGQRKRCAKRKSKVKPPSSGKRKSKAAVLAAAREKETDSKEEEAAADNDLKCDAGDCGAVEEKVEKEKLPFVHVRARRGQATDRHSLAERARREKINARMKLLQDLVPGCNKISGTALVLEEIINHVQTLQRQVEILSMRLAAVNPRFDLSELDGFLDAADALAMLEVPPEAWDGCSEVPATTTLARQEDGCLWQHLQQHQVESADALIGPHHHHQQQQQVMMQVSSPSAWGREGTDHVRLFTTHEYQNHHLLRHGHGLGYESSNPAPSQVNQVKTEL